MARRRKSSISAQGGAKEAEEVKGGVQVTTGSSKRGSVRKTAAGRASEAGLSWSHVLSGKAGSLPLVFTRDGQYFFVAVASTVRIYSTQGGRLVSTLSSQAFASASRSSTDAAHSQNITGLLINPNNPAQLVTSSLDSTVKVWDFLDAKLLRSVSLGFPITHMCAHLSLADEVIVALRKPRGGSDAAKSSSTNRAATNVIIHRVSLHTLKGQSSRVRLGKVRSVTDMAISADGRFVVIVGGRKIYVVQLGNKDAGLARFLTDRSVTRLAFHPVDNTFATGHENGQIRLWYFLNDDRYVKQLSTNTSSQAMQLAPNTILHWHAHSVSALRFNENGSVLLSGGEESTLVLWQLVTQAREYVPRLGGARLMSISLLTGSAGQQDEIIVALQDGSVAFIGVINLKVRRTLSGVLASSSLERSLSASNLALETGIPLAIEPESGHLVTMAGHPSTLQFIAAASDDAQVMQVEVVPTNRVSRPDDMPLEQARIELVCFTSRREWMATADRKASGEVSLKMWSWNAKRETYEVQTRIEQPHGDGASLTAMRFSPCSYASLSNSPLLVTAGSDSKCRTWRCITQEEKRRTTSYWVARSAFDRRGLTVRGVAFSADGSLLAVVHENWLSLRDPETNVELHVVALQSRSPISPCEMTSLPVLGGRFLALVDETSLTVVDMALGTVKLTQRVSDAVGVIALPPSADRVGDVALITTGASNESSAVFVSIDTGVVVQTQVLPFAIRKVIPSESAQNEIGGVRFFAMTNAYDVVHVSQEGIDKRAGTDAETLQTDGRQRVRTIYDELLGPVQLYGKGEGKPNRLPKPIEQKGDLNSLFGVPAHLLPPAHLLFESFMHIALPPKGETVANAVDGDVMALDEGLAPTHGADVNDVSLPSVSLESDAKKLADIAALDLSDVVRIFSDMTVNGQETTEVQNNGAINLANGTASHSATPKPAKKEKKARPSQAAASPAGSKERANNGSPLGKEVAGRKRKNSNV